jgi:hypothetical protein
MAVLRASPVCTGQTPPFAVKQHKTSRAVLCSGISFMPSAYPASRHLRRKISGGHL